MGVTAAAAAGRDAVEVVHALDREGDVSLRLDDRERPARVVDRAQRNEPAVVDRCEAGGFSRQGFHHQSVLRKTPVCTTVSVGEPLRAQLGERALRLLEPVEAHPLEDPVASS